MTPEKESLGDSGPFCSFFASVVLFDDSLGLRFFAVVYDTQLQLTVYSQHSIPLVSSCQDWCVMGLDQCICMHTHADKILVVRMRFRVFTLML